MFSKLRAWLRPAPFSGRVLAKHAYGAAGVENQIPASTGKFHGIAAEGVAGSWTTVQDSATFYLIVRSEAGKTKSVVVDEMTYNNTEIGDQWPNTLNQ